MKEAKKEQHTLLPEYDENSRILILGSFPSVKSREMKFYYGHPQNRFWKLLAAIYEEETPISIEEKKSFLHRHHIALWDVIASCKISGSSDSSITDVKINDIPRILSETKIDRIYINGGKAYALFTKYFQQKDMPKIRKMPSTSPANAAWRMERLLEEWKEIREDQILDKNS